VHNANYRRDHLRPRINRECASCGKMFKLKRTNAKFCSVARKQRKYRQHTVNWCGVATEDARWKVPARPLGASPTRQTEPAPKLLARGSTHQRGVLGPSS
jgi:hypothetical protein